MDIAAPYFDDSEIAAVKRCLDSGWVTQGPFVEEFEQCVADLHRVKYALATTSCTAGLHLGNLALGLGPGDEVLVPAFTWVTSAYSVEYVGASPVFVDIDLDTFNIDLGAAEAAIGPNTKAIMAVHLFGLPCDMDPLTALAKKHNLFVIEDAACGIGTRYKGQPVGGIGDVGSFSFHPRKIITTGEGGMITTNQADLAKKVKSLRNHGATGLPAGSDPRDPFVMNTFGLLGYNLRMSDIQAAVGVAQIEKLDQMILHRRNLAKSYSHLLETFDWVAPPREPGYAFHTYQSYVVRLTGDKAGHRNSIMRDLSRSGIQTRPGTHAVPSLDYYRERTESSKFAWESAKIAQETTITLPLFPTMTEGDVVQVVHALSKCAK